MNFQRALDVLKKVYPHLSPKEAVDTAYLNLLNSHDGGSLSFYRKTRLNRIVHCPEDHHIRLRDFLRHQNYEKSYHEIEAMEKHFSNMEISYETILSSVVALMHNTPFTSKGYFWSDTPFHRFMFSKENTMHHYIHTHLIVDDKDFGKSYDDVMAHSSKRNIYKNIFEITNDKFGLCNFTLGLPKDQTLVASHTIWRVQERAILCYNVDSTRLITQTTFTFVENNNRVDQ